MAGANSLSCDGASGVRHLAHQAQALFRRHAAIDRMLDTNCIQGCVDRKEGIGHDVLAGTEQPRLLPHLTDGVDRNASQER
jgi:hypothetical protein